MKTLKILLAVLFLSTAILAQTGGNFLSFKARIGFNDEKERIVARQFSEDGAKLTLIGLKGIQIWDIPTVRLLASHPHEIVEPDKLFGTVYQFSPDLSKVIVLDTVSRTLKKRLVAADVYDIQTGKRIAVLARPATPVRHAFWSANSATVVTFSGLYNEKQTEISFWNGADLAFRKSIVVDGYTWHYLSRDGERLFVGNGGQLKFLGLPAGADTGNVIRVYNTRTGAVEKELSANGAEFGVDNISIKVSPDERFIAAAKDRNIIVWEIAGKSQPKYELASGNPKGGMYLEGFSDDGKYLFALQSVYDAASGQLVTGAPKTELKRDENQVTPDGKYALLTPCEKATVLETATNRILYTVKSKCHAAYSGTIPDDPFPAVSYYYSYDDFKISPRGKLLLNFHNQKLEVRDFLTGALLQTTLRKTDADLMNAPRWNPNWNIKGEYALVTGKDYKSVLIWEINKD